MALAVFTILFGPHDTTRLHNIYCMNESLRRLNTSLPFYVLSDRLIPGLKVVLTADMSKPGASKGRRLLVGKESKNVHNKLQLWNQTAFERIIYLDSDIVLNLLPEHVLKLNLARPMAASKACGPYFNSGFMVFRPNRTVFSRLQEMSTRKHPKACARYHGDQNILNAYFGSDWDELPRKWNTAIHFRGNLSTRQDVNVHYVGTVKPMVC